MILRAHTVVTMDDPPIEDGAVRVRGERIIEVGKFSDLAGTDQTVDLGEHILLPGLINAHCHLDYTCLRGKIPPPQSFVDWIRAINAEKAKHSAKDYVVSINQGFAEAKQFGTTTIANLTAFPELIAKIDEPIRAWWFTELIDVRRPEQANDLLRSTIKSLKAKKNWGVAPHAPFTASPNLYRRCEDVVQRKNAFLTTHLAESREEMQMFRDASGQLYDFLNEMGRDMSDCGGTTPLSQFAKMTDASPAQDWIIAHLNELTESDFDLLAKIPKVSIVHCPRSHAYFGHTDFQFTRLRNLGLNICIGTDSLASNDDLSLFAEMRKFHDRFHFEAQKLLEMVTINPARALKQRDQLGRIRRHFLADMIALPFTKSPNIFETILNFVGKVPWIMLHGKIIP